MADLRFAKPSTTEEFRAWLERAGAPAPWQGAKGTIYDADGDLVLQVDPDNDRNDANVVQLGAAILVAVNTCAGFQAAPPAEPGPAATPEEPSR